MQNTIYNFFLKIKLIKSLTYYSDSWTKNFEKAVSTFSQIKNYLKPFGQSLANLEEARSNLEELALISNVWNLAQKSVQFELKHVKFGLKGVQLYVENVYHCWFYLT